MWKVGFYISVSNVPLFHEVSMTYLHLALNSLFAGLKFEVYHVFSLQKRRPLVPWRHCAAPRLHWPRKGRWWEPWLETTGKKWKKRRKSSSNSFIVVSGLFQWGDLNAKNCLCGTKCGEMNVKWQISLFLTEVASAQVKVVSDSPKKSVYHRRADVKTKPQSTDENLQQTKVQDDGKPIAQTQEEMSSFVFVPSKEEFCFNFLWIIYSNMFFFPNPNYETNATYCA